MLANPLKLSTIVRKLALFCRGKTKIQIYWDYCLSDTKSKIVYKSIYHVTNLFQVLDIGFVIRILS